MPLVKMIRKGERKQVPADRVEKLLKEGWTFDCGKVVVRK